MRSAHTTKTSSPTSRDARRGSTNVRGWPRNEVAERNCAARFGRPLEATTRGSSGRECARPPESARAGEVGRPRPNGRVGQLAGRLASLDCQPDCALVEGRAVSRARTKLVSATTARQREHVQPVRRIDSTAPVAARTLLLDVKVVFKVLAQPKLKYRSG